MVVFCFSRKSAFAFPALSFSCIFGVCCWCLGRGILRLTWDGISHWRWCGKSSTPVRELPVEQPGSPCENGTLWRGRLKPLDHKFDSWDSQWHLRWASGCLRTVKDELAVSLCIAYCHSAIFIIYTCRAGQLSWWPNLIWICVLRMCKISESRIIHPLTGQGWRWAWAYFWQPGRKAELHPGWDASLLQKSDILVNSIAEYFLPSNRRKPVLLA